jgi:hypothetical protein
MIPDTNPFVRGYQDLSVHRLLAITYEDDCPPTYQPLHSSQAHLRDDQVQLFPCIFCDDFALITEGQTIPGELDNQCRGTGVVRAVLYAVMADDFGTPVHVGDTYSAEAAREVVRRLAFETGHYSRCWEISSGHIPAATREYLEDLARARTVTGLLFEAFLMPDSDAVGVKLIATPWTDGNLQKVEGRDALALHDEQVDAFVSEPLIAVMELAALADVRLLIFDPNAPVLAGLPLYDD